ncbi:hypothetical protein [Ectothiorhodospira variabilis]|uniref:hypothetical protein n=1 Tax=Ectothiorhodospira variabilis TaxID=505694 RepID=UPI001EFB5177|nr:hypothetical protein [Ectothiorhodospira variabilis]MCG5495247.1 hypothetical protein [Ectothiorhodospira variabilis]MCG5504203.1 hypothetical protein [Ectothiorhodospira variabilis]MCG5507358.1 hypothetical protein [Ectothiorhodospira variabilis]
MSWRALMGGSSTPEPYPHNSHNPQNPDSGDIGNTGDGVSRLEALDSGDIGITGDGVSESVRTLARQKLATVCRELGADLAGALDWYKDDSEDLAAMPLETVHLIVSDAIRQKMIPRAVPADPTPEEPPPRAPGPLDGLGLLPEDWTFVQACTQGRPDRDRLLTEYAARWREASAAEPVPHKRDNRGRKAANSWLMEATDR